MEKFTLKLKTSWPSISDGSTLKKSFFTSILGCQKALRKFHRNPKQITNKLKKKQINPKITEKLWWWWSHRTQMMQISLSMDDDDRYQDNHCIIHKLWWSSSWFWSHRTQMMIIVIMMIIASYRNDDDCHHINDLIVHEWWWSL